MALTGYQLASRQASLKVAQRSVQAKITNSDIFNLHILAIPMFERHTADNMYNLISGVFDIICPTWRSKILSVGSDGALTMTGCIQGVVTQLEQQAEHQIYRVWC